MTRGVKLFGRLANWKTDCTVCHNSLQVTDREQPQVEQIVKGSPVPPNGDVRLPKME